MILNIIDGHILYNIEDCDLLATLRAGCTLPKIKIDRLFQIQLQHVGHPIYRWAGRSEKGEEFLADLDGTELVAYIGDEKVFHKRIDKEAIEIDEFVKILSEKFEFTLRE